MTTKTNAATAQQLAASLKATKKANPAASPCTILRALAKKLPNTPRADFLAVFAKEGLTENSISHQIYAGRNH
jgi:hypothetical protein